ncbi:hypothetical protein DN051_43960 (plasmid) [Streptomyces cadmiisoli]|uniref:Uncharacterized protein n=1 Tax=Streptomyces cadmiisoli TaxID=2184053 RepID=A0A2Z4JEY6_9ACTN|nr:hypothetical protein DN051_43960 [Streptomyces cadmiisoli]
MGCFVRGRRPLAGFVDGQPGPEGYDGHLYALVVAEVALSLEFLVQDLRSALSLVPALLQVAEVGIQGGERSRWPAHHFLPAAGRAMLTV